MTSTGPQVRSGRFVEGPLRTGSCHYLSFTLMLAPSLMRMAYSVSSRSENEPPKFLRLSLERKLFCRQLISGHWAWKFDCVATSVMSGGHCGHHRVRSLDLRRHELSRSSCHCVHLWPCVRQFQPDRGASGPPSPERGAEHFDVRAESHDGLTESNNGTKHRCEVSASKAKGVTGTR